MTMVREYKVCSNCKKKYCYNPDVGIGMFCPYCLGLKTKKSGKEKKKVKVFYK